MVTCKKWVWCLTLGFAISLMSVACLEAVDTPHAILVKQGQPVKYDKIINV